MIRSLFAATLALSGLSSVAAAALIPRNDYAAQPPCTYPFTPFDYVGCYVDPSTPYRALTFNPQIPRDNMTVELCVASCKGQSYPRPVTSFITFETLITYSERFSLRRSRILRRMLLWRFRFGACDHARPMHISLPRKQLGDLRRLRSSFDLPGPYLCTREQCKDIIVVVLRGCS